jgi:predicted acetyltransferase
MTDSFPIRAISPDEFEAFSAVPGEAFLEDWPADALALERQIIELDRTIAAFDGRTMVGTATSFTFRLSVPGGTVSAAGISAVSVLPSYRRRGILTAMMRHLVADAISRGEPLAILFASESGIYGRYGFGLASRHLRLEIRRGEGALRAGPFSQDSVLPRLRQAVPKHVQAELAKVYDAVHAQRPGVVARDLRWWTYLLADPEFARDGMSQERCLLAEDDSGPRGYVRYRTKPAWGNDGIAGGTVRVIELMATDPAATASLWTDLLTRDLVGKVIARLRPVDDPLLAMLADPRRARALLSDGLWVRLVDLQASLCQRRYAAPVDVVVDVADPALPANAGRWQLSAGGPADPGPASCVRTTAPADLKVPVSVLGAGLLGGARLGQLAAAGYIEELTPGALTSLQTAMASDPAPWSCMIF